MVELEAIAVAILGAGGALLGLLGLMRPHWLRRRTLKLAPLFGCAAAAVLSFAAGSALMAVLPLALGFFWTCISFADELLRGAGAVLALVQRPRLACALILLGCPLLAVGWSQWSVDPPLPWEPPLIRSAELKEVVHGTIRTDAGRVLRVAAPVRPATADELREVESQKKIPNLICTDGPGIDYNCHGWVFTGGRFWLYAEDVKRVLQDNGYVAVDTPAPGDIIIYYNDSNYPVHTGLVRAADERGIIIESKWDIRGRYIHLPEAQDYSARWVYYRSGRAGHLLAGISAAQPHPAASLEARPAE